MIHSKMSTAILLAIEPHSAYSIYILCVIYEQKDLPLQRN